MFRCARRFSIPVISCGILTVQIQPLVQASPSFAARQTNAPPVAVIVLADLAHVSNANASGGTSVYPGDSLDTAPSGELRLTIAGGQVYLLSDTAVRVDSSASVLRATLLRGTIGFTSLTDRQFQIVAPEGLIEAADHLPARGQVTITGPSDLVISAYNGALFLHRGDQSLVVKAGQSYYVSLVRDRAPSWRKSDSASPYHLVSRSVLIGTATGVGYWLWRIWTESPVDP